MLETTLDLFMIYKLLGGEGWCKICVCKYVRHTSQFFSQGIGDNGEIDYTFNERNGLFSNSSTKKQQLNNEKTGAPFWQSQVLAD